MDIKEFLALPHRFQWGGNGRPHHADPQGRIYNDCTTFAASWVAIQTGFDPASSLRSTYRDKEGAEAIFKDAGGILPFAASVLEPIGYKRVQQPQDGDVGIIHTIAGLGYAADIAAIRFGPLWATLGPQGVVAKKAQFIAAWRLVD